MTISLGVDTGGTFTDFVLLDHKTGAVHTAKVPSTPSDPSQALARGMASFPEGLVADQIVIGTTVGTNAVIERRGPRVAFVTNAGLTDVPFIGRLDKERLYDLQWRKPRPLVRRRDCVGVPGRVAHDGEVLEELDERALAELVEELRAIVGEAAEEDASDGVVVAICCLFSYLRPEHEARVAAAVRAALPGTAVSVSHAVSPVWREYERASTTIADAFVKPVVEDYVDGAGAAVAGWTGAEQWNMLASNGGYLSADEARATPAQLLLSGLAGGVIGGRHFGVESEHPSLFTLDMGGTSCDVGLVLDGEQRYVNEFDVSWGIPVTIPCVDVATIGAGGGSILWVDRGGMLHVGPRSAGAEPGPVAYGKGGAEPTLTDANLVLGRLNPDYFLGGAMRLDAGAARAALTGMGSQLGLSAEELALAAVRIADENMANAIRLVAVERGLDPRRFALAAFGGAGAVHGRAVAARLDMTAVLIPPHPGLCSAFGSTISDARVDRVRSAYARSDSVDVAAIAAVETDLRGDAIDSLRRTVDVEAPVVRRTAQLRYLGQNYELEVELPDGPLDEANWARLLDRFAADHAEQHGFALPGETVELTSLRVTALRPRTGLTMRPALAPAEAPTTRPVVFAETGEVPCAVHRRDTLAPGTRIAGPAIVEEVDSTTVVFPGDSLTVHESGVLVIDIEGELR